ncbi:MAG: Abi family protein [Flavobacteriales bacterium]|nr:Abi family protein [Flavobacteriales bacterium]
MAKAPQTIQQQIALLKGRNMAFRDEASAPHFLANISYYRLKGYWWEMQDDKVNHHFKDGSFFEDVVDLYNFDRHFRLIVFNAIERIEIALRTKMIYHLSLTYGAEWYLDSSLFPNKRYFSDFQSKIHRELTDSSEEFIVKHYQNHPTENPESWKALEVLTLGALSKLFKNLEHQLPEKNAIAAAFGLYNQKYLGSWLIAITLIRNIIAHHGRLWNRVIINKYDWPATTPRPLLGHVPDNYQRRKIFPILSAIMYLTDSISPGHHLRSELLELFKQFPKVELYRMGFPKGWENEPTWKLT